MQHLILKKTAMVLSILYITILLRYITLESRVCKFFDNIWWRIPAADWGFSAVPIVLSDSSCAPCSRAFRQQKVPIFSNIPLRKNFFSEIVSCCCHNLAVWELIRKNRFSFLIGYLLLRTQMPSRVLSRAVFAVMRTFCWQTRRNGLQRGTDCREERTDCP